MYSHLLSSLDHLGFGLETTGKETIHIPMAYGTLSMAAAIHGDVQTASAAADWLCANSTSNRKTGWGLNWPWDAFSNGVINPADTLYGVTVAVAVDGLLRTYQLTGEKHYLTTAVKALKEYADQHTIQDNHSIYFHYSDQPADQGYRVANITAMLMAQFASVGTATNSPEFIDLGDKAYRGLMAESIQSDHGLHWRYCHNAAKPRGNDLIHASFIVYGLHRYLQATGYDAESHGILEQAADYLNGFVRDGVVYEVHCSEKPLAKNIRARSWAVGMLLFVAKQLGRTDLADQVLAVVPDYEFTPGQFSYRYGDRLHSPRAVAFLLLGVA